MGDLVTVGADKVDVLNACFISVFTSKVSLAAVPREGSKGELSSPWKKTKGSIS